MSENDKELCLKEISSDLLDAGKMVNISTLSENWGLSMKESADLLGKWLKDHVSEKSFYKQFLVRGVAADGSLVMTILPEEKVAAFIDKHTKTFQMLYSINEGSEPPAIVIPTFLDYKRKRLVLPQSEANREPQNYTCKITEESSTKEVKQEKPNTFSSTKNVSSKLTNGHSNNGIASMFKNVKTEHKSPTKSQTQKNNGKTSPKKMSPTKKETGKKTVSIGSFFSAKPQTQTAKSSNESVETNDKEQDIKEEISSEPKSETKNGKRSPGSNDHSDKEDETKNTASNQNPPKRRKVAEKKKARAKGSRIMMMVDSDDEEEPKSADRESEEPEESAHVNDASANKTNSTSQSASSNCKNGRAKKRRMVTKTYEDEDGFIKTVKENEEYSCSEPEEVEPAVKVKMDDVKLKQEDKKKTKTSPTTAVKATRKPPSKQGSIMSFFSKK